MYKDNTETLFLHFVFKWCFGFRETYPNEKYKKKKKKNAQKGAGNKCISLGLPKMGWPSEDAIFQNQDKKT